MIMYYIWKKKGFKGTISELARQLGYRNDTPANKRINNLISKGWIKKKRMGDGEIYRLTYKGERKIYFLIMPRYTMFFLVALALINVYWGTGMIFFGLILAPISILTLGLLSVFTIVGLLSMYRSRENELWEDFKASAEKEEARDAKYT